MENKKDTIVYTFGRFQPPTSGHQLLIDKVISVAKKQGAEHRIYPSVSNDPKKNPLSHTDKVKFMKQMFKKANIVNDKKIITPFHAAKQLSDQGYKNVILVVGGDRVADLRKQISQYINHKDPKKAFYFDSFKVVSAGKRDPDSSDISGMSASKMRKAVSDKDFDMFMKGMPDSVSKTAAKKLYNAIAKGMNLKEDRDYKDEYEKHHSSPEQRARRIRRTVTRKKAEREGRVSKGDGKDIDHKDHNPHNDSPSNLRIKSKSANRSDNGHNPGEKQKQHEETEVDELTIQQRLKMSRTAKRTAKKRLKTRLRKKKLKKGAGEIKKKAGKEALNALKKKFSKGKRYADLSHSEKEKIDAKIKKVPKKRIEALTKKMLKVAKEKEKNRIAALRGVKEEKLEPKDREMGTKSLTDTYAEDTPGQSTKGKKMKSFKKHIEESGTQQFPPGSNKTIDLVRKSLDKIGVAYSIDQSGKKIHVNPANVMAAKKALNTKFKGQFEKKTGMSVVKNKKMTIAQESVELHEFTPKSMDSNAALAVYNKLKKGSKVTVEFGGAMSSTKEPLELVVSSPHRVVGKSKVGRIILKNPKNMQGMKYTLYNRNGKVSLAQGDMATILKNLKIIKESVELDEYLQEFVQELNEYLRKDIFAIVDKRGKVVAANLTKQNSDKEISRHRDGTIILDPDAKVGDIQKYFARKESVELDEVSPPGFEGTVKAMKKHKEIDNPYALAWYMKNKGFRSHKKKDGSDKDKK